MRPDTLLLWLLVAAFVAESWLLLSRPYPRGTLPPIDASLRIDVNSAAPSTLTLLPRIGPALAKRIVADRVARGPFASLADLDRVPGIGPKTIAQLTPYATCDRPAPAAPRQPR